jgi:hypothetical protein
VRIDHDNEFKKVCLRLRNGDPAGWDAFVNHVGRWTNDLLIAVSEADAGIIMTVKGRALQSRAYLQLFSTCDQVLTRQEKNVPVIEPAPE